MDERFDKFFLLLHKLEGGYSNHPADKGGATYYGVWSKHTSAIWYLCHIRTMMCSSSTYCSIGDALS